MTPKASVVTVCYGEKYAAHLNGAVASVLDQTAQEWEHVIVADEVAAQHARAHPRLRIVPIRHLDHIEAWNIGVAAARGKYIVMLDVDDRLDSTYLQKTSESIDKDAEYAIAQTDLQEFGDNQNRWSPPNYDAQLLRDWNIIPVSAMYTKTIWSAVGGYEVGLFGYEDWNFWIAASRLSPSVTHVREPLFRYNTHTDGLCIFQGNHDSLLRAMMKIIHRDLYQDTGEARATIATMSDEAYDVIRKRLRLFPDNKYLQEFYAIAGAARG